LERFILDTKSECVSPGRGLYPLAYNRDMNLVVLFDGIDEFKSFNDRCAHDKKSFLSELFITNIAEPEEKPISLLDVLHHTNQGNNHFASYATKMTSTYTNFVPLLIKH
jgi:hypothetical protein